VRAAVSIDSLVGLASSLAVLAYLVVAMVRPEKF
jgi:K+-transporting ATPase KdpF subunit